MGRSPCCKEEGVKKGPWTTDEDDKLRDYITRNGHQSWRELPRLAGLNRCGKSCRLRWTNYLRPDIKRGKFDEEEEEEIIKLHSEMGNKWSAIASRLSGRTDNEIKNHWNTHLRKKLMKKGIDPVTHKPMPEFTLMAALTAGLQGGNSASLPMLNPLQIQAELAQWARVQLAESIIQVLTAAAPGLTSPLAASTASPHSSIGAGLGATFHQLSQLQHGSFGTSPLGVVSSGTPAVIHGVPQQIISGTTPGAEARFSMSTPSGGLPWFASQTAISNTISHSVTHSKTMPMHQQQPGLSPTGALAAPNPNSGGVKDAYSWNYPTGGVPAAADATSLRAPQMDALDSLINELNIPAADTSASVSASTSAATPSEDDSFSNCDFLDGILLEDIPSWASEGFSMESYIIKQQ